MAVDALVRDDLEETLSRVLQRCEFDAQTLDFVKGLFRKDLGLDIPSLYSTDLATVSIARVVLLTKVR